VDRLAQEPMDGAPAPGEMEQAAGQRSPGVARHPDLSAGRVIDVLRQPADWLVVVGRRALAVMRPHVAVKTAATKLIDSRSRHPFPLLIGASDGAEDRVDAQPDGMTKSRGENLVLPAI